jgi:hypothetical protein
MSSACLNSCVADYTPPVIEYVHFVTTTRLEVVFSEALDPVSAEAAGAYRAANRADGTGEIAVTNAALQGDGVTVLLDLAEPFPGNVPYILREIGVADLLGNAWVSYGQFGNGPNLVVSAVYAPDTIADFAQIIPCSLEVTNIGSFPAGAFRVGGRLQYLDESGSWMSNEALDSYYFADCTGLLPGASFSCAFDFYSGEGYQYYSWAEYLRSSMRIVCTADVNGSYGPVVDEASEQDNVAIAPVTLLYPIPFGDTYEAGSDVFRLEFWRSPFDDPALPDPVTSYEVYRRSLEGTTTELAATIPATGSQIYTCDVPRLPDREFVYLAVKAIRPGPGGTKSYTSCEALMEAPFAPTAPTGLRGLGFTYRLLLIWNENPEPDMSRYRVYRGTTPDFIPNSASMLGEGPATHAHSFSDDSWYPGAGFYYKVSAVDHRKSDNESECALLVGDEVVATTLQAFSAGLRGDAVEIAWSLATGSDTKGFAVMRKPVAIGEYEMLPGAIEREGDLSFKYRDQSVEPGESYRYCVAALEGGSQSILFETEAIAVPKRELALMQNHPNPFNPTTTIEYELPESGAVSLTIYDVAGRRIAQLVNARQEQGSHAAQWTGRDQNGSPVASGMYFYKLDFAKQSITRKMVFLR